MSYIDRPVDVFTNTCFSGAGAAALTAFLMKGNLATSLATGAVFGATAEFTKQVALVIISAIGAKCKAYCNPSDTTKDQINFFVKVGVLLGSAFAAIAVTAKVTAVAIPVLTAIFLTISSQLVSSALLSCCDISTLSDSSSSSLSSVSH